MGHGDDGDLRLLAQSEAKPEGAVRGEIADQDVRQRLVTVGVFVLRVRGITPGFTVRAGFVVLIDDVTALAGYFLRFRLWVLVLSPHKTALDADSAVMVEDDEGPTTRNVRGVIGLTLRLKPLDLGFKLAEARIDFIGQFLGALVLLRQ